MSVTSASNPFSASDAALEGFQLIRRRWRVVLGWAGFNLLALVMLVVVTAVLGVVAGAVSGGQGAATVVAGLIVGLGTLALQAIIAGGVFRLELKPEQPAFMHLRLGGDEFRLVVVWLLTITAWWVVLWLTSLVAGLTHLTGVLGFLAAIAVLVYFSLRISLAAPVAFAERRIDFPRAWRLSRGRVVALLGMAALNLCLIALFLLLIMVVLAAIAGGVGGLDAIGGLFGGGAEALKRHPGLYALEFGVNIVLTPVLWTLASAPWIVAYRTFATAQAR